MPVCPKKESAARFAHFIHITLTLTFQIATRLSRVGLWICSLNKHFWSLFLDFELAGTILVVSQCLGQSILLQSPSHFPNSMKVLSLHVCAAWPLSALVCTKKQFSSLPCHCLCIVREQYPYIDKANGHLDQYGNPSMRHTECGHATLCKVPCGYKLTSVLGCN